MTKTQKEKPRNLSLKVMGSAALASGRSGKEAVDAFVYALKVRFGIEQEQHRADFGDDRTTPAALNTFACKPP